MNDEDFTRAFLEAFTVVDASELEQGGVAVSAAAHSVINAFPQLDDDEGRILALRVGLDRGEPRSIPDVARAVGLSVRAVRRIERRTLSKLRHPSAAA